MTTPPGWPRAVPDPESPAFPDKVVGWLLDLCPPDYRGHDGVDHGLPGGLLGEQ